MKNYVVLILVLFSVQIYSQNKKPLTVEDLWSMKRVSNVDVSSDGNSVLFSIKEYSMEANTGNSDIMVMNSDGSSLSYLKNSIKNESSPKFTPSGNQITYLLNGKLHKCDLDGKNDSVILELYTGVNSYLMSRDETKILFTSEVYSKCVTQECNERTDNEEKQSKVEAKVYEDLLFRHWDSWRGKKRSHLFLYDVKSSKYFDLSENAEIDVPTSTLGGSFDYTFSPDGNIAAVAINKISNPASNTNNDIYIIDISKFQSQQIENWVKISESNGNDNSPVFSPDGRTLAFLSMERAGFEADKKRIALYNINTSTINYLTENIDYSFSEIIWTDNSNFIYSTAANKIYSSIFRINIKSGELETIIEKNVNNNINLSGNYIYYKKQTSRMPYEVFMAGLNGEKESRLTNVNKTILDNIAWEEIETFWSKGAEGARVQSILVKPPYFKKSKKYPMIFLIHGGPQGHWTDDFHYRWNIQMFAAKGYVVVATNPRGSVGYGQGFTDGISKDWGGKAYIDLMNSLDYALANYKFIDSKNIFAAGASYGGYMAAWIEGHTDRFNAIVDHDGLFDLESFYGTTEELWFPEWEMGGTPYDNPELYEKWSPNKFVNNFKTPMLVIQGGNDFRVPEAQAFALFTALQKKGVESKLLYFPNETHFVLKPQNAKFWWKNVFDWFQKFKR